MQNEVRKDSPFDSGPSYYRQYKIQPIEFIMENELGFLEGNIVKYICRYKQKNGIEDLIKARHYLDFLVQQHNNKIECRD